MKKHSFFAVILLILMMIGCSSGNGNKKETDAENRSENKSRPKHLVVDEVSVDYPRSWKRMSEVFPESKLGYDQDLGAEELGILVDPGSSTRFERFTASVRIEKKEMPPGSSLKGHNALKDVFGQAYQSKSFIVDSEKTTTIGGMAAYEKIYKKPHGEPWYQVRDVWLQKNGTIYIISCWALPDNFAKAQSDFDMIIKSFRVE